MSDLFDQPFEEEHGLRAPGARRRVLTVTELTVRVRDYAEGKEDWIRAGLPLTKD